MFIVNYGVNEPYNYALRPMMAVDESMLIV